MKNFFLIAMTVVGLVAHAVGAQLPNKPTQHFNDYAGLVSQPVAAELDSKLSQLETETTTQFVVALFPEFPKDEALEDFTQRTASSWGIGQKKTDNGVVFFMFLKDPENHTLSRIEVGYGLEGILPDVISKNILDTQIRPHIRAAKKGAGQPEWDAMAKAAVNSIIAVVHGEYKAEVATPPSAGTVVLVIVLIIVGIILFLMLCAWIGGSSSGGYSSGGYSSSSDSGSSSSWGGGGGDFGGGGASGSD